MADGSDPTDVFYDLLPDDEENAGSGEDCFDYCYSPDPDTEDAPPTNKKPAARKPQESLAKQRKQLEKDLAAHKKLLEQTKKKIDATKKKLVTIKKKEVQQKKMLAQKKQKLIKSKKNSPKQQKPLIMKKRIVEERFYL